MKKDFENRKTAIWAKWERNLGKPLSQDFRESMEANLEVIDGEADRALTDLDGLIQEFFDRVALIEYFSSRKKPKGSTPKKRYQRCFEKRLYLVEFVMGRHSTIASWGRKSINLRKRISWKQICVEWNKAHPNDHMNPEVLKVRYYRAIAEEDIQREYIKRSFMTVQMNLGAELYDFVEVTDPQTGVSRVGNIGEIREYFKNGKWSMEIRFVGDELSSEKSSPEKY